MATVSGCLGLISGIATTYWAPGASGSGVAEMIGYLNGVNYPNIIGIPTLVTKIFGVVFAVVGRLCVGKEGPLAHIGANVGVAVIYLPKMGFEFL
jgi:chloride channel 7